MKTVAAAVPDMPIFMHNNSGRQPFDLQPETFARIVGACKNVVGVKEVVDSAVRKHRDVACSDDSSSRGDDLSFFSGSDKNFVSQFTSHGFTGLTSVAGQVFTKEMGAVVAALRAGDAAAAEATYDLIRPGVELLAKDGAMLQSIKYVLQKRGAPAGYCCLPLSPLSAQQQQKLDQYFGFGSDA